MTNPNPPTPSVLTIEEAAHDLQIETHVVWKHHRDGRLAIMYTSGSPVSGRKGAKGGRIAREEWERFKRALMVNFKPEQPPEVPPPRKGRPSKLESGGIPTTFAEKFAARAKKRDGV